MSFSKHSAECEVYLCWKTNPTPESFRARLFEYVKSPLVDACINHFLVVFDHGGTEVLICEAGIDHAGILTGRYYWNRRAAFTDSTMKKMNLGRHQIPESRIEELLKKMGDCGRYHLTKNNSQKWTLSFLQKLDITPPEELHREEEVVHEVVLLFMAVRDWLLFLCC